MRSKTIGNITFKINFTKLQKNSHSIDTGNAHITHSANLSACEEFALFGKITGGNECLSGIIKTRR